MASATPPVSASRTPWSRARKRPAAVNSVGTSATYGSRHVATLFRIHSLRTSVS
jgi:hypothetical protein